MSLFKDVSVVQYYVRDWETAKKFYLDVLGWPVAFLDDRNGWMEFGEEGKTHFAINRWDDPATQPPGKGCALAVFTVENAVTAAAALRMRGIRCDNVEIIAGVVAVSAFYDPEGNCIQFASLPPEPSTGYDL